MSGVIRTAALLHTRGLMALVKAYFDDSGTHAGSPAVVIGGVIGPDHVWDQFDQRWAALLNEPLPGKPPISAFHLTDLRAGRREFEGYNEAERDRTTYLFRQVILETDLYSLGVAIDRRSWDELVTGQMRDEIGNAEAFCAVKCVDLSLEVLRKHFPGDSIEIGFDAGRKSPLLSDIFRMFLDQPDRYPELVSIGWAKVAAVRGMQGADMIATETYWYAQQWLKDGADAKARAHFTHFMTRDLSFGVIADREVIHGLCLKHAMDEMNRAMEQSS